MNKNELIELRNALLAEIEQNYTNYITAFISGKDSEGIFIQPIGKEKSQNIMAVKYYETKLEEIIKNAIRNNVNFNGISSSMYLRFFITKEMADKVDDTCHLQPELFDKNNIIKDIVEVTFSYDFIGNANELAEDYLNNPFEPLDMKFLINYERFIKLLSERGFNVSITTFEDALNSAIEGNQPIITADFTKKSEFKK